MKKHNRFTVTFTVQLMLILSVEAWAGINFKVGLMRSKMEVGDYWAGSQKTSFSYQGFVFYPIPILETATLEPGIVLSREVLRYYSVKRRNYTDFIVHFMKLNLMVNVQMLPTRLHLLAGPYFVHRLGNEIDDGGGYPFARADNKTGWGMYVGFRYYAKNLKKKRSGLFVEVLADMGISQFKHRNSAYEYTYYRSKNFSIMVGYGF
jgi:hypothetical protein